MVEWRETRKTGEREQDGRMRLCNTGEREQDGRMRRCI
jgi:hypothetical protein